MNESLPLPRPQADTSPERIRQSLRLRFNPLRSLTPELLVQYLDNFRLGFFRNIALAWDAMERRDDRIASVAGKRKKAVSRHGWEILTLNDSPEAMAQKQGLEFFYNNLTATTALEPDESGGVSLLLRQMMDAVGKRYAVHEIVWQPGVKTEDRGLKMEGSKDRGAYAPSRVGQGASPEKGQAAPLSSNLNPPSSIGSLTATFRFCPLWWFEGVRGKLRYLPNEMSIYGIDLEPNGWMVTVGDGIMEACSVAYMYKHLPLKDWLSYSEKFGMPGLLGKTDAAQDSPEWQAMADALRNFSSDWSAVISSSTEISAIDCGRGSHANPYQPLVEMMNDAITILWRGGDLGTKSKANAVGASLQESETDILDLDDAAMLDETLEHHVSRVVRAWHFGANAPALAWIKIKTAEKTHVDSDLKVDSFLLPLGILGKDATLQRYNRPIPAKDEEVLQPPLVVPPFLAAVASERRPAGGKDGADTATPNGLANAGTANTTQSRKGKAE